MNDNFIDEQDQIAALLELLPRLKAELHLAKYEQSHKASLLNRIDEQYQKIIALQQAPKIQVDPFYCAIADPVSALKDYQFTEEVFHTDEMGHCQVQLLSPEQAYGLENILAEIDIHQDWDTCFEMLKQQTLAWLLALNNEMKKDKPYHTHCRMALLHLMTDSDFTIALLQDADTWYWDSENKQSLYSLLATLTPLLQQNYADAITQELEMSMLNRIKSQLEERYHKLSTSFSD